MNKINTIQIVQLPKRFLWILNLICEKFFPNKKNVNSILLTFNKDTINTKYKIKKVNLL
jgi:hypothetical protein